MPASASSDSLLAPAAVPEPSPPSTRTGAVSIRRAEDAADLKLFIRLPRLLYRGLPGFVPPLDLERRNLLHPKHAAFFRRGRARFFLAFRGTEPVGRISAHIDPLAIEQWGAPIGLFGALDAADDAEAVAALLAAACAWLAAEGMERARGPYALSPNDEVGLLVQGERERPMLLSPWHPSYLGPLVESAGFRKVKDLVSYDLAIGPDAERALPITRARLMESAHGEGITVRRLRPKRIAEDAAIMGRLSHDAWADNWGFIPITDPDVSAMVKELKPLIRPEHLVLVERDGEPVGFALVLPNIYDAVDDLGGRPSPLGWIKLAWRMGRHRFRSGRVILLGISDTLRNTTLGALMPSMIIAELMKRGRDMPLRTVELGWILEDNTRIRRLIERMAPHPNKVFRLYERALPLASP